MPAGIVLPLPTNSRSMSMGADDHHQRAGTDPVTLAIVTVSDSRTPETDKNKQYIETRMTLNWDIASQPIVLSKTNQTRWRR